MSDNTRIDNGTTGDNIATDDVGGVKHQRMKVEFGDDGSATDVSATNPLPGTVAGLPLPSGASTSAKPGRLRRAHAQNPSHRHR
jgi:hypothetical protein